MTKEKNFNRRSVLAALGIAGVYPGIAGGEQVTENSEISDGNAPHEPGEKIKYDARVANDTYETVSGKIRISHNEQAEGLDSDFRLGTRRVDLEDGSYLKKIKNLPSAGGDYTVEVDVEGREVVQEDIPMSKKTARGYESISVSIKEDKIAIGTEVI